MVQLIFPQKLIKKPVIYSMAVKCKVVPNVRRAKVTETVGNMTLELEGTKENLEKGIKFLIRQGVKVEPVMGDVIES
jgi:ABC-type methionine transport system ATPase subunit